MSYSAAIKNFRICVCVPKNSFGDIQQNSNISKTTFVVIDSQGHFISKLQLSKYEKPLFNPINNTDIKQELIQYLQRSGCNPMNDEQELISVNRKEINEIVKKSFKDFKSENDENVQRILDEAKLIDFLCSNAVCAVAVCMVGFDATSVFNNVQQTLKYINQPVSDEIYKTDMQGTTRPVQSVETFLQYVSVPKKGINAVVGKNPLYINDFIFKKMMLPKHIKMILSTQVQI